jgi:hypothetical protein
MNSGMTEELERSWREEVVVWAKAAGVLAEIRTKYLRNASQERLPLF